MGAFVICQHAFVFLELLSLQANDYMITLAVCSLISLFFLVYSYAIAMNGKAVQIFKSSNSHILQIVEDAFTKDLQEITGPQET